MTVIVVIASSTRGFTTPRDGTPPVINPCPSTQHQDEKAPLDGAAGGTALDSSQYLAPQTEPSLIGMHSDLASTAG
jgi:hypothetical protein